VRLELRAQLHLWALHSIRKMRALAVGRKLTFLLVRV
jgi:hypothetical protein